MTAAMDECVICQRIIGPADSGLCDAHKYDEQLVGAGKGSGYGVRGDVRKRLTRNDFPHPDPAVRELIEKWAAAGWDAGYQACAEDRDHYQGTPATNPYRGSS